ncbi:MAG: acyl-CoA dehydrogenase [Burkholderiaceae bacterium]|nr:acyl-CoA dehydrogenase [Burkholderiaceae bacterium]
MDFNLTEDQVALENSFRRFLDDARDFDARRKLIAAGDSAIKTQWKTFADMGWLGLPFPEAMGGSDGTVIETMLLHRELGRALAVDPLMGCSLLAGCAMQFAGGGLLQGLLPRLIDGSEIFALAHQDLASRPGEEATRARRLDSGEYLLQGRKSFVLGGPYADKLLVACAMDDAQGASAGAGAQQMFVVDAAAQGVHLISYTSIDDQRWADVTFAAVRLAPESRVDATRDIGAAIALAVDHATLADCADALGVMERCVWTTRDYLRLRRQFGKPLSSFQALRHKMSDMLIELEQARSSIYAALGAWETSPAARQAMVSAAKVHIARSGELIGSQAVQLHGAIGVTDECDISHCFRRLTANALRFGGVEHHLRRFQAFSQPAR